MNKKNSLKIKVIIIISFLLYILQHQIFSEEINFTEKEQKWLSKRHTVRVRVANVPPFHFMDSKKAYGISIDYLNYISEKTGIRFSFKTDIPWTVALENIKECKNIDLLPTIHNTDERSKFIRFTDDYLFMPWVIISRNKGHFISNIGDLNGKTIAVEKGYIIHRKIINRYPDIKIITVANTQNALKQVASGRVNAYIGDIVTSSWFIRREEFNNLKISAPTPFGNHTQAMGIRYDWPELAGILSKTIKSIPIEKKNEFQNKWLSLPYNNGINKIIFIKWFALLLLISLLVITIIIFWNRKLKIEIKAHKKTRKELDQSHERFRSLFEKAPLSYQSLDENGNFIEVNETWLKIMGYQKNEVINRNFSEFLHPDWKNHFKENFPRFKSIGEILGIEFEMLKKDGSFILVSFHGKIGFDNMGHFKQTHCVFWDITKQKELEEQKIILDKQIQNNQKLEAIGTLAGGIAHDFNNMLSIIIGNASYGLSILKKEDELHEILTDIQDSSRQASMLTNQLLTFAKGGEPVKTTIDLNKLIEKSSIFSLRGSKSILKFELDDSLSNIEADEAQISQVIQNLIFNANQSMPEGGVITAKTENIDISENNLFNLTQGKYVKFDLIDQGTGIPESILHRIFDPYFTTKKKGNGLGLATTFSIVKKHNGIINVKSKIDYGSTFTIYIPASSKTVQPEIIETISHKGGGNILIMDDETHILSMITRAIKRLGYNSVTSTDGKEAVNLYKDSIKKENPFDLVILDLTVPGGLGGVEAVKMILETDPGAKVIVSSGYSNDPVMSNYSDYGFTDVIPKPYTIEELSKLIETHCN